MMDLILAIMCASGRRLRRVLHRSDYPRRAPMPTPSSPNTNSGAYANKHESNSGKPASFRRPLETPACREVAGTVLPDYPSPPAVPVGVGQHHFTFPASRPRCQRGTPRRRGRHGMAQPLPGH
jgi:hypothetical protein